MLTDRGTVDECSMAELSDELCRPGSCEAVEQPLAGDPPARSVPRLAVKQLAIAERRLRKHQRISRYFPLP
jgi:hypothetical protein